ncbi:MAG: UDP-3-O-(3-hydroxymyristoyl)glucosamine N-acyltransferase [Armatimonadota bacterium]
MENKPHLKTLADFAAYVGGELVGEGWTEINQACNVGGDCPTGIAFAENAKYVAEAATRLLGGVIVPAETFDFPSSHIKHANPRLAYLKVLHYFERSFRKAKGIHPTAFVEQGGFVDDTASIGAMAFVASDAIVRNDATIMPFAYIGPGCVVGEGSVVMPHAILVQDVIVGHYCVVGPGTVIGHSGFGYVWDGEKQIRIPQVGGVRLGDRVEIGALTAIDRATAGQTRLDEGNKIDNLVQIAHNVELGPHGVYASGVGIAGSTKVGARAMLGGQSGYSDHLVIADGVVLAGRAAGLSSIDKSGVYGGTPAIPIADYMRSVAAYKDLPKLIKRVRALEKEVKTLKGAE